MHASSPSTSTPISTGSSPISNRRRPPKGLNEDIVRFISAKKGEPQWLHRLASRRLSALADDARAELGAVHYPRSTSRISIITRRRNRRRVRQSLDEVDPELLRTYEKLGIPLREQEILAGVETRRVAVDAVFDSVSVATTFKAELAKAGVIFCPISEAVREHPNWCGNISARSCR